MKSYLAAIIPTSFVIAIGTTAFAEGRYTEISCAKYGNNATGCDECFDGGTKHASSQFHPDLSFSAGDNDRVYWKKENTSPYEWETLSGETTWDISENMIGYDPNFTFYISTSGSRYALLSEGDNIRMYATRPNKGVTLVNNSGASSDGIPDGRLTFTVNYHSFLGQGSQGEQLTLKSCIFYDAG